MIYDFPEGAIGYWDYLSIWQPYYFLLYDCVRMSERNTSVLESAHGSLEYETGRWSIIMIPNANSFKIKGHENRNRINSF